MVHDERAPGQCIYIVFPNLYGFITRVHSPLRASETTKSATWAAVFIDDIETFVVASQEHGEVVAATARQPRYALAHPRQSGPKSTDPGYFCLSRRNSGDV
jgi:hypothetical protein